MSRRSNAALGLFLSAIACVLIMTCGGDDGTAPVEDPQDQNPAITLSKTNALPFEAVEVMGMPTSATDLFMRVTSPTGVETTGWAEWRSDGKLYLIAPLNNDDPIGGGMVSVRITNGSNITSQPATLTIDPLPPAPGAFAQMVTTMQSLFDSWLAVHGTTREDLRAADLANLQTNLLPLYVAQELLDNPANPNSLRAFVDGPIPLFNNETIDFDLIDRLMARTGFQGLLDDKIASVDSLVGTQPLASPSLILTPNGHPTITNAAQLNYYMTVAQRGRQVTTGAQGKVLSDVGFVIGLSGLYPPATVVATGAAAMIWAYQKINEGAAGILPSSFSGQECDISPDFFEEDRPGPGTWKYRVSASSTGWKLDKLVLEAIMQYVGARGSFGDWVGDVVPNGVSSDVGAWVINEATNRVIGLTPDAGVFEIPPHTWENIDVTDDPWSTGTIVSGNSISITGAAQYDPVDIGVSTLRLQTGSGLFGNRTTFKTHDIEVAEITVTVLPSDVSTETDQDVELNVIVQNAMDKSVIWSVQSPGAIADTPDESTIIVRTPSAAWDPPFVVTARSLANTGLRALPGAPVREGQATIRNDDALIVVSPIGACLAPNEQQFFDAVIIGAEDQRVTWAASAGSFNGDLYTAPPTKIDRVEIVATSVANTNVKGYSNVIVSDCLCWWSGVAGGEGSTGTEAHYFASPFAMFEFNRSTTNSDAPSYGIQLIGEVLPPNVTGQFDAVVTYVSGSERGWFSAEDEKLGLVLPKMTVTFNDGTRVEAFVTGQLFAVNGETVDIISVSMAFSAVLYDGVSSDPCDVP